MIILSFIVGALLIAAGTVLCFCPLNNFLQVGQIIAVSMLMFSVTGVVQCIINRSFRADFFISLLGIFAGAFLLCDPLLQFMTDTFVMHMVAVWLLMEGIMEIVLSVQMKKKFFARWWVLLIVGILNTLFGIFCIMNPLMTMLAIGFAIAFYFIDAGVSMIACGLAFKE